MCVYHSIKICIESFNPWKGHPRRLAYRTNARVNVELSISQLFIYAYSF